MSVTSARHTSTKLSEPHFPINSVLHSVFWQECVRHSVLSKQLSPFTLLPWQTISEAQKPLEQHEVDWQSELTMQVW